MGKGAAKGALEGAKDGLISGMVMGGVSTAATTVANGHGTFCFVAGTTVLTTLGKKAIETVQVGDTVPCVDHITGEVAEKKVITTTVNKVNRLTELDIDGEVIQCTETHPFQVKGKGWVDACELHPGDIVYTKDWNTATVNSIGLLELDEPVEVFNFEVEDFHTYFIGDILVLVHNALCSNPYGRKGGPAHQNTIRKEEMKLQAAGYDTYTENAVDITNGFKKKRFTDLMGKKGDREIHIQVGKITKSGIPVSRERQAIDDLLKSGKDVIFVPYNG